MDSQAFEYLQTYLTERRKKLFTQVLAQRTKHFTVVMEDVYQLHNTSAVMRSCDVFGIQELHVVEERLGKRVDREIAMGAQKWIDLQRYEDVASCMGSLKNEGYQIIATTPHHDGQTLSEFDITKKSALFFGTERKGVSAEVLEAADGYLKIPMYGFTESLNISVSAAIILQDLVSRLKRSTVSWQLSEAEKRTIEIAWTLRCIKSSDKILARYSEGKMS